MSEVACLVPRIRARPKVEPRVHDTVVHDLPVKIYTEVYEGGQLVFSGLSENTIPLLIGFIKETSIGRSYSRFDHRSGQGTYGFETRDGSVKITSFKRVIWALDSGSKS